MRALMLATLLAATAAPALALAPPAAPQQPAAAAAAAKPAAAATAAKPGLPADWLDDADLDSKAASAADVAKGSEGDDRLAGGDRGARNADLGRTCQETSGTTGLILGAVAGGLLGNVIDGGDKRTLGTLVGAGGGALLGREIEKRRAAAGCK